LRNGFKKGDIMNIQELAEDLGLDEEEYLELIDLFVETGMSDLDQLQSAIQEGNAEEALKATHSLKGAAANLGFMEISDLAKDVEMKARDDRLDQTAEASLLLREKLDKMAELVRD